MISCMKATKVENFKGGKCCFIVVVLDASLWKQIKVQKKENASSRSPAIVYIFWDY